MSITEKIKTINNKIEQNKPQYYLDRQTAKISALSSGNVSKQEFLTGKDVLPEKDLLEKATTMKGFEYLKQYQKVDNTFVFDKIIKKEKPTLENYRKSNLLYDANQSFYRYCSDKKKLITFLSNQCILI